MPRTWFSLAALFIAGALSPGAFSAELSDASERARELGVLGANAQRCFIASPERLAQAIGSHLASALSLSLSPNDSSLALGAYLSSKSAQAIALDQSSAEDLGSVCLVARRQWSSIERPQAPVNETDYPLFLRLSSDSGALQAIASRCSGQGSLPLPNQAQSSAAQTAALLALASKSSSSLEKSDAFYRAWRSSFESETASSSPVSESVCQAAGEALSISKLSSPAAEALILRLRESAKLARQKLGQAL